MTKLFLAAMLAASPVPAFAEPAETTTTSVEIADLDLSTISGKRMLDVRLRQAVREVCGEASDADIAGKNEVRRCRVETLALVAAERNQRIAAASVEPIRVAIR